MRTPEGELAANVAQGFAAVLRERTSVVHRQAERSGFIADLIRGRATRAGYALFLRNFVPVYDALEHALDGQDGALFGAFADRALRRGGNLRDDLAAIAGPRWEDDIAVLPAAEDYAYAVRAVAADPRLVAHAYARYLGDLSGGQILKPVLARTLGLSPEALTFYDFPAIADLDAPKAAMRRALDSVDPESQVAEDIAEEAIAAFHHNIAVSQAVQTALG